DIESHELAVKVPYLCFVQRRAREELRLLPLLGKREPGLSQQEAPLHARHKQTMVDQQMMLHQVHVAVERSSVTDVDDARAGHPFPAAALVNHEADVIVLAECEEFEPGNAAMGHEVCADGLRDVAGDAFVI